MRRATPLSFPFFALSDLGRVSVLDPPARLAVFGHPVSHSRSPQMHNAALRERGIAGQYIRLEVHPSEFHEALDWCREAGFAGVNCTIPHKLAAFEAAEELDLLARQLGVVNTLAFRGGRILGFNTDGPGLVRALDEDFRLGLEGIQVLVLGAGGGAGRAAAIQCALAGCAKVVLVNRTRAKADAVAQELARLVPLGAVTVQDRPNLEEIDLLINATSVGMKPDDPELIPAGDLKPRHRVYDMIYSPAETRLLHDARAAGARAANGLSMLLHQGAASFAHWFGEPVPVEAMRRGLIESL
jgi:shikimate dehydrogenase